MSLMLGPSIRFIFPSPPVLEFVAAAILLFNSSLFFASYGLSTRLPLPLLCSWLKGAPPGILPKQHRAKKKNPKLQPGRPHLSGARFMSFSRTQFWWPWNAFLCRVAVIWSKMCAVACVQWRFKSCMKPLWSVINETDRVAISLATISSAWTRCGVVLGRNVVGGRLLWRQRSF